ncbi:MAG: RNA polymerase sigma factor, partial [Gemmatimonadota bacterium]
EEREELVQDVRIRLWRALETDDRISSVPAAYVYRAAVSAAVDLIRRRRARREVYVDVGRPSGEAFFGHAELVDLPERSDLTDRVGAAVEALLPSRRPVVRMYLAGYKLDEIAQLLGWTNARTRNLLYRGLEDIRESLKLQGLGPERGEL